MKKILVLLLLNFSCSAQGIKPIVQSNRYSNEVSLRDNHYYFFAAYFIDPEKKGVIDLESLEKGINNKIKDVNYSGYIVLDIENKVYQELKSNPKTHINYENNIKSFVDMVNLVKRLRPNSKVVIYNIPFMFHYEGQKSRNDFEKLYPLLSVVDVFAPSLYLHYNEKQRKSQFFSDYINNNLDVFFEYAEKLNKKVYPFVWYKIHPANKNYGGNIISATQYSEYLNLIKDYRYKGKRVEKVIYWEPSKETIDINKKLAETIEILK